MDSSSGPCVLVLGDLHGSPAHRDGDRVTGEQILQSLEADLAALRSAGPSLDAILLVGDHVPSPSRRAYAIALERIERIAKAAAVPLSSVFAVPGNHDVDRAVVDTDLVTSALHDTVRMRPGRIERVLAEQAPTLLRPFDAFSSFAARLGKPSESPHWFGIRSTHFSHRIERAGHKVRVVGWSTVLVSDSEDRQGSLVLPVSMLDALGSIDDDELLLVFGHHPIAWLNDATRIRARIDAESQIYAHAHRRAAPFEHAKKLPQGAWEIAVGGAYAGEPADDTWRWVYAVCSLEPGAAGPRARIDFRSWQIASAAFESARSDAVVPFGAGSQTIELELRASKKGWIAAPPAPALKPASAALPFQPVEPRANARRILDTLANLVARDEPVLRDVRRSLTQGKIDVPGTSAHARQTEPAPPPPSLLSADETLFVGRSDVVQNLRARIVPDGGVRIVALQGAPGEGKSAVLRRVGFLARQANEFVGGIFWIDAQSPLSTRAGWEVSARAAGAHDGLEPPRVRFSRAMASSGAFLLLVDGVNNASTVHDVRLATAGLPASVVFTTADPAMAQALRCPSVFLPELALTDATTLLEHRTGGLRDQFVLSRISKLLGRNAFAIATIAGLLPRGDALERFVDDLARRVGSSGSSAAGAIFPALELFWASLDEATRTAAVTFSMAAAEVPAPLSWIRETLALAGAEPNAALAVFERHGLLSIDRQVDLVRIHALTHAFARVQSSSVPTARYTKLAECAVNAAITTLGAALDGANGVNTTFAAAHAEALLRIAEKVEPPARTNATAVALTLLARHSPEALAPHLAQIDVAYTPDGLAAAERRVWALDVLEQAVQVDQPGQNHDASRVARNAARLADLMRTAAMPAAIESATALMTSAVDVENASEVPDDSALGRWKLDLAEMFLASGSPEDLEKARACIAWVLENAASAGEERQEMLVRGYSLQMDLDARNKTVE